MAGERSRSSEGQGESRSERLEQVRELLGFGTLKEFWRELTSRSECSFTYEAVRNYHTGREAPADYYLCVSDAFGIRLRWLLTGEGAPRQADEFVRERMHSAGILSEEAEHQLQEEAADIAAVFPYYPLLPQGAQSMIWEAWRRYAVGLNLGHEQSVDLIDVIGECIATPMIALKTEAKRSEHLTDYVVLMSQALMALAPLSTFGADSSEKHK